MKLFAILFVLAAIGQAAFDPDLEYDTNSTEEVPVQCVNKTSAPNLWHVKYLNSTNTTGSNHTVYLCGILAPGCNTRCPYGMCCSKFGYCGPDPLFAHNDEESDPAALENSFCEDNHGDYRYIDCELPEAVQVKPRPANIVSVNNCTANKTVVHTTTRAPAPTDAPPVPAPSHQPPAPAPSHQTDAPPAPAPSHQPPAPAPSHQTDAPAPTVKPPSPTPAPTNKPNGPPSPTSAPANKPNGSPSHPLTKPTHKPEMTTKTHKPKKTTKIYKPEKTTKPYKPEKPTKPYKPEKTKTKKNVKTTKIVKPAYNSTAVPKKTTVYKKKTTEYKKKTTVYKKITTVYKKKTTKAPVKTTLLKKPTTVYWA